MREPLTPTEITLFTEQLLSPAAAGRLMAFYEDYHRRNLAFFVALRQQWHSRHPGDDFPGLCANVDLLSGLFRPEEQQVLWGWGDGRALGVWCSFLIMGRVPSHTCQVALADGAVAHVQLPDDLADYASAIHAGLKSRLEKHGCVPFRADRHTGDPVGATEGAFSFSDLFAASGFLQYGLWKDEPEPLDQGMDLLQRCLGRQDALDEAGPSGTSTRHGPRMITLGVIAEALKSISHLQPKAAAAASQIRDTLLQHVPDLVEFVLDRHYRHDPVGFWEIGDGRGQPQVGKDGLVLCDPGHATECAGFLAELSPLVEKQQPDLAARMTSAAVDIHLFADRIGFLSSGAMTKFADLLTGRPLPDTQASAGGRITAPWWNVREHCAAALRLFTLTGDRRLVETFRRAQHASYRFYPNRKLFGQMIQMIDAETREPLDVAPATGNLDPMHDPRARVREMENLDRLMDGPSL